MENCYCYCTIIFSFQLLVTFSECNQMQTAQRYQLWQRETDWLLIFNAQSTMKVYIKVIIKNIVLIFLNCSELFTKNMMYHLFTSGIFLFLFFITHHISLFFWLLSSARYIGAVCCVSCRVGTDKQLSRSLAVCTDHSQQCLSLHWVLCWAHIHPKVCLNKHTNT